MKLILVRHGESVGNFENRLQGQTDYELTELGRRQAALTCERLARMGVRKLYSSPLLRALATAQALAACLDCEPELLDDLSEYHFGEMSGATFQQIRDAFAPGTPPDQRVFPGEEGRDVFFRRVTEAIRGIAAANRDEAVPVAVVSHGGPIALYCQSVLGLPYRRPMPFAVSNCSLSIIEMSATGEGVAP